MELITPAPGLFIWLAISVALAIGVNVFLKKKTNISRYGRLFISIGLIVAIIVLIIGTLLNQLQSL